MKAPTVIAAAVAGLLWIAFLGVLLAHVWTTQQPTREHLAGTAGIALVVAMVATVVPFAVHDLTSER